MTTPINQELIAQQQAEITEYHIYKSLSEKSKNNHNKKILKEISQDELKHYKFWKNITKKDLKPKKIKVRFFTILASIFGLSFALRYMEKGEQDAQKFYDRYTQEYPEVKNIIKDEDHHEQQLISILNDERLDYAGAIVLGLNDALVELTGTLAGLTLAFRNTKLIGTTGLIMGIAAAMSMAASGYLSSREEDSNEKNPVKSALYTGVAYIVTVILLVIPYFLITNIFIALAAMLTIAILIILIYTFYISIAKNLPFRRRFLEMALISMTVATISFAIGYTIKIIFGIEI